MVYFHILGRKMHLSTGKIFLIMKTQKILGGIGRVCPRLDPRLQNGRFVKSSTYECNSLHLSPYCCFTVTSSLLTTAKFVVASVNSLFNCLFSTFISSNLFLRPIN